MDHLAVLREKIARLRVEIADLQELNDQYRRETRHEPAAQIAHSQRHERLEAIRQELAQLADLGRRVLSMEEEKRSTARGYTLRSKLPNLASPNSATSSTYSFGMGGVRPH